jgi:hypothetical protein
VLFFAFEEFFKISSISQKRDDFGQIFQLHTNNSKSFLSMYGHSTASHRAVFFI